jgi:hypothetical protein
MLDSDAFLSIKICAGSPSGKETISTLSFGMNNFLYFCCSNPEERFELIATSLKNAKAVFLL